MDVKEMLERENLLEILKDTILHFFNDIYGQRINLYIEPEEGLLPIYLLSRPGILAIKPVCREAMKTIMAEYSLRGSIFKFFAAKTYIFFRTIHLAKFSIGTLYTDMEGKLLLRDKLIVPNNKSIRIFDYKSDSVYSVVKAGFSDYYIQNQIRFRNQCTYDFVLPMIESGSNWFRERILRGHALARTRNNDAYMDSKNRAIADLEKLFSATCKKSTVKEYIEELRRKTSKLLNTLNLGFKEKTRIAFLESLVESKCSKYIDATITVGLSHGDFQTGNIWRDELGKTWIYDWETVDFRSQWYDKAVMFSGLRTRLTLSSFYLDMSYELNNGHEEDLARLIVILEEIVFILAEATALRTDLQEKYLFSVFKNRLSGLEDVLNNG